MSKNYFVVFVLCMASWSCMAHAHSVHNDNSKNIVPSLSEVDTSHFAHCNHDELQRRVFAEGFSANVEVTVQYNQTKDGNPFALLTASGDGVWKPIRIGVSYEDLKNPSRYCTEAGQSRPNYQGSYVKCKPEDVLTKEKIDILIKKMIPKAVQLHADRLMVRPLQGIQLQTALSGNICGSFTVPRSHYTTGVQDVDYLLYVAAGPMGSDSDIAAWAVACLGTNRFQPIVGVTQIAPSTISTDRIAEHTVAHEILHALGYSWQFFDEFGMTTTVAGLRDKPIAYALNSSKVVEMGRQHYGCDSLNFVELEDEGGQGTAQSH